MRHRNSLLRLIRQSFAADFVVYSLLDCDRTVFVHSTMSGYGDLAETLTIPRASSGFCDHVLVTAKPLIVPQASVAEIDLTCSVMRAEGLEGYLGVPLWHEGQVVGTLDVITRSPRNWTQDDALKLMEYAQIIMSVSTSEDGSPELHRMVH